MNKKTIGIIAISAKKNPPNIVNLLITDDKYSVVDLPVLIPGINPPFFLILLDISAGLNVAYVQKNVNPTNNRKYIKAFAIEYPIGNGYVAPADVVNVDVDVAIDNLYKPAKNPDCSAILLLNI